MTIVFSRATNRSQGMATANPAFTAIQAQATRDAFLRSFQMRRGENTNRVTSPAQKLEIARTLQNVIDPGWARPRLPPCTMSHLTRGLPKANRTTASRSSANGPRRESRAFAMPEW